MIWLWFIFSFNAKAHTEIWRLNFFPATHWSKAQFSYGVEEIQTYPTSEAVHEYLRQYQILEGHFGYCLDRHHFVTLRAHFGIEEEHGPAEGSLDTKEVTRQGLGDPELGLLKRWQHPTGESGSIDLYANWQMGFEERSRSFNAGNRHAGRHVLSFGFAHGYAEAPWEFRTELRLRYHSRGEQIHHSSDEDFDLKPFLNYQFNFLAQYQLKENLFLLAGPGVRLSADETLEKSNDNRLIQRGTAALFQISLKQQIKTDWISTLTFEHERGDYYAKSRENSFDGKRRLYLFSFALTHAID